MNLFFTQKKISGILTVLPSHEQSFDEDMKNFASSPARSLKLKLVMGYDRHRLAPAHITVSDMAVYGLQHLFAQGLLQADEFDALIVVTQSPDHFIPPTSNLIQGRLKLKRDLFCMDINQGCAGYLIGLFQSFMLLEQPNIHKVVLVAGDVLSHKVSPKDRNSYPLIGDAVSITVIERATEPNEIYANLQMDGSQAEVLMIPAGGFRLPSSSETAILEDDGDNNLRAKDHLRMDGAAVFNFVQLEVPPMINALLQSAGCQAEEVDAFVFHQPNRFMLHKLAEAMQVPKDKMPSNVVENYGNSSCATIPMALTHNFSKDLENRSLTLCLAGFGVGLTWSSMLLSVGPLQFCQQIDFPCEESA